LGEVTLRFWKASGVPKKKKSERRSEKMLQGQGKNRDDGERRKKKPRELAEKLEGRALRKGGRKWGGEGGVEKKSRKEKTFPQTNRPERGGGNSEGRRKKKKTGKLLGQGGESQTYAPYEDHGVRGRRGIKKMPKVTTPLILGR